VQYRIQCLVDLAALIRGLFAGARNAAGAIARVVDLDWPPNAASMRALDPDGREVHSKVKGETRSSRLCGARGRAGVPVAKAQ
jgi:hypothetical protein